MISFKKWLLKLIKSIAIICLIEVLFLNFSAVKSKIMGREVEEYPFDELAFQNWNTDGDVLISAPDPIIYKDKIAVHADTFTVKLDTEPMPQVITIFYTTGVNEVFSGEKMIVIDPATGNDTVSLDARINAIRVDPGEAEGVILHDVSFIFNEVQWDISIARIIAMLTIYWGLKFLMTLQGTPDYSNLQEEINEA